METSLFLILGLSLAYAALLYYIFIVRRQSDIGSLGVSAMMVMLFIITPIMLMAVFSQSGAEQRLKEHGFSPHPNFTGSVGVATGEGENPIWVFSTDTNMQSIVKFYKKPGNHDGWLLVSESNNRLVFVKKDQRMSINISSKNVAFTVFPE